MKYTEKISKWEETVAKSEGLKYSVSSRLSRKHKHDGEYDH